jgi:hypothetical protein
MSKEQLTKASVSVCLSRFSWHLGNPNDPSSQLEFFNGGNRGHWRNILLRNDGNRNHLEHSYNNENQIHCCHTGNCGHCWRTLLQQEEMRSLLANNNYLGPHYRNNDLGQHCVLTSFVDSKGTSNSLGIPKQRSRLITPSHDQIHWAHSTMAANQLIPEQN